MNKLLFFVCLLILAACLALLLGGCQTPGATDIEAEKETVFGVDISYSAASSSPRVRIGLIRRFHQRVPTSTNHVYAPDYATSMDANIRPLSQSVRENFGTGAGAGIITNFPPVIPYPTNPPISSVLITNK